MLDGVKLVVSAYGDICFMWVVGCWWVGKESWELLVSEDVGYGNLAGAVPIRTRLELLGYVTYGPLKCRSNK